MAVADRYPELCLFRPTQTAFIAESSNQAKAGREGWSSRGVIQQCLRPATPQGPQLRYLWIKTENNTNYQLGARQCRSTKRYCRPGADFKPTQAFGCHGEAGFPRFPRVSLICLRAIGSDRDVGLASPPGTLSHQRAGGECRQPRDACWEEHRPHPGHTSTIHSAPTPQYKPTQ
ncbi:hypothetical protein RRG08_020494 [Elysia crispata]|uniref:Uncharacterized protein n=1 Tax=Elysia crispata TaxID=231223 RepID=A0AAE0ZHR8_9GAST|nr:hypothetical protein RRG08_020494 [Elysia crispata]